MSQTRNKRNKAGSSGDVASREEDKSKDSSFINEEEKSKSSSSVDVAEEDKSKSSSSAEEVVITSSSGGDGMSTPSPTKKLRMRLTKEEGEIALADHPASAISVFSKRLIFAGTLLVKNEPQQGSKGPFQMGELEDVVGKKVKVAAFGKRGIQMAKLGVADVGCVMQFEGVKLGNRGENIQLIADEKTRVLTTIYEGGAVAVKAACDIADLPTLAALQSVDVEGDVLWVGRKSAAGYVWFVVADLSDSAVAVCAKVTAASVFSRL